MKIVARQSAKMLAGFVQAEMTINDSSGRRISRIERVLHGWTHLLAGSAPCARAKTVRSSDAARVALSRMSSAMASGSTNIIGCKLSCVRRS